VGSLFYFKSFPMFFYLILFNVALKIFMTFTNSFTDRKVLCNLI